MTADQLADTLPDPCNERSGGWLAAWRERRFAQSRCRAHLARFRLLQPRSAGSHLQPDYLGLVMAQLACTEDQAARFLEQARIDFAEWPVSRPLQLRDVVHALVAAELQRQNPETRWQMTSLQAIVQQVIPLQL